MSGARSLRSAHGEEKNETAEELKLIDEIKEEEPDMRLKRSSKKVTCEMSANDACPLADMHNKEPSLIFPGGNTSCLEAGSKYAFHVYPGKKDKLYLHFQGGGACWDEMTTTWHRGCKDNLGEHYTQGLFNRSDTRSPIRKHTIVMVVYCSGDVHVGDTKQPYGEVEQRGYYNAKAAIDWVATNFADGLKSLVIGGCSAGSLGAQAWVPTVLERLHYKRAAVVFDSYLPLFPQNADGVLMNNLGTCGTPLIVDANLEDKCKAKELTFGGFLQGAIEKHPNVTFAVLNSKADGTQQHFGNLLGMTLGLEASIVDDETYFSHANEFLETLNKYPNFVSFMVGGDMAWQHCWVGLPEVYTATVNGTLLSTDSPKKWKSQTAAEWIGDAINYRQRVRSNCFGERLDHQNWSGISYCDDAQLPKAIRGRAAWVQANAVEGKFAERHPVTAQAAASAQAPWHLGSLPAVAGVLLVVAGIASRVVLRRRKGWRQQDAQGLTQAPAAE